MVMPRPPSFDAPTPRRLTRERILQHVQPAAQAVSSDGVPGPGEADARRASRAGLHVLGAVRGDVVLPARARPFAAGDLRRAAQQRGQAPAPGHHGASDAVFEALEPSAITKVADAFKTAGIALTEYCDWIKARQAARR